jgi:hypothetical protein
MISRVRTCVPALLLAVASTVAGAADPTPQDFAYGQSIITTEAATGYRVALPLEVYRTAVRADLGDLRIFNAGGEIVPYALRRPH